MRDLYDGGLDILGGGHVTVLGRGHGGGGHRGGGGRLRGGRGWGGWGWPGGYDYDGGDTYILNFVDVPDEDEDDDVLGMIDIQSRTSEMNNLKQLPLSVARIILKDSQAVINRAITMSLVSNADFKAMTGQSAVLPGQTDRKNTQAHLQWHENELQKYANSPPEMIYPNGDDLKKWAMAAWIEANAVEEGSHQAGVASYLDVAWGAMWAKIVDAISRLPKLVADAVTKATTLPDWAKWTMIGIGSAAGLGLGYGVYRRFSGR